MQKFSYSNYSTRGWIGQFDRPADALLSGRAAYGNDIRIFIARWKPAQYSDLFIGGQTLLSYMRENGADRMKDEDLNAFDSLDHDSIRDLHQRMLDCLEEWEYELPLAQQFTGTWIETVKAYGPEDEVRVGHFK